MLQFMRITPLVLLYVITSALHAQKQANIWHFGEGKSIDFSSGEPVLQAGSQIFTFEGCASYCDSLGNFLMYTNGGGREPLFSGQDGGHIWNRNNEIMYDMQGIQGGGFSSAQSSVIVEAPGQPNVYYVFTMEEGEFDVGASAATIAAQPLGRGFRYFTVDMSLNGGLGGVVLADQAVYSPTYEALCAIRQTNQTDYWILINHTDGIGVYSLTSSGVQLNNVYSAIGPSGTIIKASPDGEKVVFNSNLLEFNPSNGQLSNPIQLSTDIAVFTAYEFSHNSRYLYEVSTGNFNISVERFDLNANNILASQEAVGTNPIDLNIAAGQMQLAPDGRIYFVSTKLGEIVLHRINCPNTATPSVEQDVFSFPGEVFNGLPNFPAWIFENNDEVTVSLGPENLVLCESDFPYTLDAQNPGATYLWSNGSTTQTIEVSAPGTYSVTVTGDCGTGSSEIVVLPCAAAEDPCTAFDLGDTLTVCGTDTVQLQADLSSFSNVTGLSWTGGSGTFIPSNTIAAPRYVPTAAERAQGFVNLSLQVDGTNSSAGQDGKLIAYDHLSEDLIFYISPLDGSIDTIQDNAGDDWIATGFESATSTFYGISAFLGLGSIDIQSGVETPITFGYQENIFAGEFDNTNGIFYAVGVLPSPVGDPANQQLYSVNSNTGALTVIGNLNLLTISTLYYGIGDGINGLAYDPQTNVLYGISYNGNLYRINVNDASTTLMGPTQSDCRGLAYDASTQKLWAIASDATLYEIDKNTGSVLSTVPCQENFNFITSLTYAPAANDVQEFTCTDNVYVLLSSDNFLNLGNDTLLCNTPEFTLSQPGLSNYLWQDGSDDAVFTPTTTGLYTLQASNLAGCVDTDSITIQFENATVTVTATPSSILLGDTVQLSATGGESYSWNLENELSCLSCAEPFANPTETTTYIVTATDSFGCRISDTIRIEVDILCNEPFIPTIFSPNGKGNQVNETFCVYSDCVEQFKLVIHNRWGEKIFESEDISQCWDGTFKGSEAATGTYAFNLFIRQIDGSQINKTGTITLVR